jgi:hypothetical protein
VPGSPPALDQATMPARDEEEREAAQGMKRSERLPTGRVQGDFGGGGGRTVGPTALLTFYEYRGELLEAA